MNEEPIAEAASVDRLQQQPQSTVAKLPRVWTVFAAIGLALFLAISFQAGLGAVTAMIELSRGVKPAELSEVIMDRLVSPYGMILTMAAGTAALGIAGFLPALLSPVPFRERVAWATAHPSWRVYPMAMLSSLVPLAIGLTSAEAVATVFPVDESILKFFDSLTIDSAIVFVLFVGIAPGVCEEVLFRGYIQQRVVKRWGAAAGIIFTSIFFGLFHITPASVAAALPLGFWFGYLAWRSRSIVPAMLSHFFVNSGLNAWRMIIKFGGLSETAQNSVYVFSLSIGAICFAVCCWPAFWRERAETK